MSQAGNVYGQGLYALAKEEGLQEQILGELAVLETAFTENPDFPKLLASHNIPRQERTAVLDESFRDRVHPYVLNFLKILTEKGYIKHFSGCCRTYRQHYNRDNGIVTVTAYTAIALPAEQRRKLTAKLSTVTGKTIELDCRIDPEALGGVRLDFDGKQVDGTVRRRLEDIRGILKNTVL